MQKEYYGMRDAYEDNVLSHHGILGQKWGIRRFQNPDGSLTPAGRERYYQNVKKELSKPFYQDYSGKYFRAVRGHTSDGIKNNIWVASNERNHDDAYVDDVFNLIQKIDVNKSRNDIKKVYGPIRTKYPEITIDLENDDYFITFDEQEVPGTQGKYGGNDVGSPEIHYYVSKPNKVKSARIAHY